MKIPEIQLQNIRLTAKSLKNNDLLLSGNQPQYK